MIEVDREGVCLTVTLNRPDKANSLTAAMLNDMVDALTDAMDAKVVILTGTGKVFSAGADLDEARAGLATDPVWEKLSSRIATLPALTIAALNGTVAGGAFGMVLACDLRIAVADAKFFYPVMRLGFLPQPSDPGRLAAIAGPSTAKRILMAGEKITASEALRVGLLDKVADASDLVPTARLWAQDASQATTDHIANIRNMI